MTKTDKLKKSQKYGRLLLLLSALCILGGIIWRLFIVAESSIGFTNLSHRQIGIYKITLNGRPIYAGPPKIHDPGVTPAQHGHYFGFFTPRRELNMAVYFIDQHGQNYIATHPLDHRTGRYIFWCKINHHNALSCVHDDIFDFGH